MKSRREAMLLSFITSVRQRALLATIPRTEKMATLGHPKSAPKNAKERTKHLT